VISLIVNSIVHVEGEILQSAGSMQGCLSLQGYGLHDQGKFVPSQHAEPRRSFVFDIRTAA
jgi:hypothetical protein